MPSGSSKVRCPTARRRASGLGRPNDGKNGAGDGVRTRDLHLGKVTLYQLSHSRSEIHCRLPGDGGAESQNRTGDTAIFSRVLYRLSYLGMSRPVTTAATTFGIEPHRP